MKNRLHDKKAGIFILVALILISLAELIFRAVVIGEKVYTTPNVGEQLVVIALALTSLILLATGKERLSYLCFVVWISYFMLDQLFELPGVVTDLGRTIAFSEGNLSFGQVAPIFKILNMCGIVALGSLLIEYMNDGSIYNRAFNIISVVTVFLLMVNISISCFVAIKIGYYELLLESFNSLYRLVMVFLFTFFAYNSAKKQLSKVNFDK